MSSVLAIVCKWQEHPSTHSADNCYQQPNLRLFSSLLLSFASSESERDSATLQFHQFVCIKRKESHHQQPRQHQCLRTFVVDYYLITIWAPVYVLLPENTHLHICTLLLLLHNTLQHTFSPPWSANLFVYFSFLLTLYHTVIVFLSICFCVLFCRRYHSRRLTLCASRV